MDLKKYTIPWRWIPLLCACLLLAGSKLDAQEADQVYFTTGFKVGEVRENSAMIWTRLCANPEAVPVQHDRKEAPFRSPIDFDENMPVDQMDGAVEGAFGQVRITLESENRKIQTEWDYVSSYEDYSYCRPIDELEPYTRYQLTIEGRQGPDRPLSSIRGSFRTAPSPDQAVPVLLTSTSCQYFWDFDDPERGFLVYDKMRELKPDFHCQTGDYVYYDKPGPMADRIEEARHKWHANNAWPSLREFYAQTPLYLQKDDHDMMFNDASPNMKPFGELSFQDGLKVWYEQVPVKGLPYRTFRWGKDLQIWVVEGREFRSDNWVEDGPDKSIWGKEQKDWFVHSVEESDATFKLLLSPTPVVGPDRSTGKNDNHSNQAFETEGEWLRGFLGKNRVYVINGDRHWQYVSVDKESGCTEFSQGPSSDSHAQGWKQEDLRPEHRFLRVMGGFLAVEVKREENRPVILFTHYDVHGRPVHREQITKD